MSFKSCVRIEHDALLISKLQGKEWGCVLDVGSKDSRYKQYMKHIKWTSLDLEPGCDITMDICEEHPDQQFDTVLCTQVLEHCENAEKALRNVFYCLKPTGKLILTIPFFHPVHATADYTRWTMLGIRNAVLRAGFTMVDVTPYGNWLSVLWQLLNVKNLLPNNFVARFAGKSDVNVCHGYLVEATR